MSEKHDVTKSSNPDIQALLAVITGLAREVAAIRGELAALPDQYVVPGPNGELPPGTVVVNAGGGRGSYTAEGTVDETQSFDPPVQGDAEVLAAQGDDAQAGEDDDILF